MLASRKRLTHTRLSHVLQLWKDMPTRQFQVTILTCAITVGIVSFFFDHSVGHSLISMAINLAVFLIFRLWLRRS